MKPEGDSHRSDDSLPSGAGVIFEENFDCWSDHTSQEIPIYKRFVIPQNMLRYFDEIDFAEPLPPEEEIETST